MFLSRTRSTSCSFLSSWLMRSWMMRSGMGFPVRLFSEDRATSSLNVWNALRMSFARVIRSSRRACRRHVWGVNRHVWGLSWHARGLNWPVWGVKFKKRKWNGWRFHVFWSLDWFAIWRLDYDATRMARLIKFKHPSPALLLWAEIVLRFSSTMKFSTATKLKDKESKDQSPCQHQGPRVHCIPEPAPSRAGCRDIITVPQQDGTFEVGRMRRLGALLLWWLSAWILCRSASWQ